MCLTLPDTLISLVGVEKILLSYDDLEIFLKLLCARPPVSGWNLHNSGVGRLFE